MKKAIFLFALLFFAGISFAQRIQYAAPVPHTAGAPTETPTFYNSWLRYDKTGGILYKWATGNETWTNVVPFTQNGAVVYQTTTSDRMAIGTSTSVSGDRLTISSGNLNLNTAGNKIKIATGSNASVGTATLVAGTVTIATSAAVTGCLIFVSRATSGGTAGHLAAPTASISNGVSFVISSSSGTDTSTVNWWIIN